MSQEQEEISESETPLINYVNRLQKQMFIVTTMLSDSGISFTALAAPIRMLIYNLPPNGQLALDKEIKKLKNFEKNIMVIPNRGEMEAIYQEVHKWAYEKIFQDIFRAKPRFTAIRKLKVDDDDSG